MRLGALIFFGIITSWVSWAGPKKYPVNAILPALRNNADIVYRENLLTFTIESRSRAVEREFVAITILNDRGREAAQRVVFYSRLIKVNSISGAIYDAEGTLVRKIKDSEISDQSASGSSLFSDHRVKVMELNNPIYPYTLEFESEIEYKFLFYMPTWLVVPEERAAVEHSRFTVVFPTAVKPRYKIYNSSKDVEFSTLSGDRQSWVWDHTNVQALERDPFGPSLDKITPVMRSAPQKFEYDGYFGDMSDWKGFGKWIRSLNAKRDILPEETKQEVRRLTQDKKTVDEKVRVLYQFLQNKTRYVSVQIGIGGYQPFEAAVVDKTSYGDCKALSNYMVALLKEAGIKGNYVLINSGAGQEAADPLFASTQFDHAIAAVPMANDTIWLECTSQTTPYGYSGRFTGDRKALMVTDTSATMVNTPQYHQNQNLLVRNATVVLNKDGSAQAKVSTTYTGLQYEGDNLDYFLTQSLEEQKKWVLKNTEIPSFELKAFSMSETKDRIPQAKVNLDLTIKAMASVSGKRFFLNPNLMNRSSLVLKKVEDRKSPVILRLPFSDSDTVLISYPEELYAEFVPKPIHYQSQFGVYDATFEIEAGKLKYTRTLKINKGTYPASSYNELIEFYKNVNKADNIKLVFLNKT